MKGGGELTQNGEKCTYLFDGDSIRRGESTERKRNYFEKLYDREKMLSDGSCSLATVEKFKKRERLRCIVFRVFLFVLISVFMITLICSSFFKIDNVKIGGSEKYENEKLVQGAEINGKNLIFLDADKLEKNLKREFPYIKNVEVRKNYPNEITLVITENEAKYYCLLDGKYCILSSQLDVLEICDDVLCCLSLVKLEAKDVKTAVVGEKLTFGDKTTTEEMSKLVEKISTHEIFDKVTCVELDKTNGIKLLYDSRLTVVLGNNEEIDVKMTLACAYIDTISDGECGIVYANNTKTGSFLPTARNG